MADGKQCSSALKVVKVTDTSVLVGQFHLHFGSILKECRSVLHLASLHPVVVDAEGTTVDCLQNTTGFYYPKKIGKYPQTTNLSEKLNLVRLESNDVHVEHLRCVAVLANANQHADAENRQLEGLPSVELFHWSFLENGV